MIPETAAFQTSENAVLGGRLRLRQPLRGHRVGHDAMLLAAATGAAGGERAVDLGAGVGGAGLALALRVSGLKVSLVEIDAALARLAADNAELNRLDDRARAVACDAEDTDALAAAGLAQGSADRVLMNPPFHDTRRQNVSPDPRRRRAHAATPGLLRRWVASAAFLLKVGGVLTLIWRADELDSVLAALSGAFGAVTVLPVLPGSDRPAIRVLVRAMKGGQEGAQGGPTHLLPLVLNDAAGRPSAEAEAVLRHASTLPLAGL